MLDTARELFINFCILVTLTFLCGIGVDHFIRRKQLWLRRFLIWLMLALCAVLLISVEPWLPAGIRFDLRAVPAAAAGFFAGPLWGLAVALPIAVYRYGLGGSGWLAGVLSISLTGLLAGLLRLPAGQEENPLRTLVWRAPLAFGIANLSILLIPDGGLALLRHFWLPMTLAKSCALLVVSLMAGIRMQTVRTLQEATALALTDHLTGLPNLRAFEQAASAVPAGVSACLLLLDLDNFKRVNDTYGHQLGDQLLQAVAAAISGHLRSRDTVGRYGGEEFAILLRDCPLPQAVMVGERVRRAVAGVSVAGTGGEPVTTTVSGGLVPLQPEHNLHDEFAAADALLYRAKAAGRDRIVGPVDADVA